MSSQQPSMQGLQRAATAALREHWVLFLVEGVVLLVLGATAIVLPPIATLAVTILLGWLFLVSGIVGLVTSFWMRHAPGFWWSLLSAVLAVMIFAGLPSTAAWAVGLLVGINMVFGGTALIAMALHARKGA